MNKRIVSIAGGTFSYYRAHLAICAPAFGRTGRDLETLCQQIFNGRKEEMEGREYTDHTDSIMDVWLYKTRMAGGPSMGQALKEAKAAGISPLTAGSVERWEAAGGGPRYIETNEDISKLIDDLVADDTTKIIFMPAALCDWEPTGQDHGKYAERLKTSEYDRIAIHLKPAEKIIRKIREKRKDIFLVGFKTTTNATEDEQYIAGLGLCKQASCNLVLANDTVTRLNMVVTPEEARYHVTKDRKAALTGLVEMAKLRSHLTFTRSTVVEGHPVSWHSPLVPPQMHTIVNWLIHRNAYKPFNGSTAGHFAIKLGPNEFLTSIRKTDFNKLDQVGLVRVVTDGPDTVIAYGAKPSVGGQSQRIVFNDHPGYNCIVHFHCPIKPGSEVPVVSQREYECGSHQCGQNTSHGLKEFGGGKWKAVYLDEHGPNILFNCFNINAVELCKFILDNFDLDQKTGGFVSIKQRLETGDVLDDATKLLQ